MTILGIGEKFGHSARAVASALKRQKVEPRRKAKRTYWTGDVQQKTEAVRLYRDDAWSFKAIAKKWQVRAAVIEAAIDEADVPRRPGGLGNKRFRTDEEVRQVAAEYAAGQNLAELAAKYQTTQPTISKAVRAAGGEIRPATTPRLWTEERIQQAVAMWEAGHTQNGIAATLGCRFDAVSRVLYATGAIQRPRRKGADHPAWLGGRFVGTGGYIMVLPGGDDLQYCPGRGDRIQEHRLVMARSVGRPLLPTETVHHINGDRADNRLENLQLRQGKHGIGVVMHCNDCGSANVSAAPLAEHEAAS